MTTSTARGRRVRQPAPLFRPKIDAELRIGRLRMRLGVFASVINQGIQHHAAFHLIFLNLQTDILFAK